MSDDNFNKCKQKTKRTPVEIPDSAREVKARFWAEPERAKVLEIARYVSETGKAHLHPDVTYGPIADDCDVRFLEVFSLAKKFKHDEDNWCVCAACKHDLPQFKDNGVITWLPDEGTIKIVGWDCFKRHNPEAHKRAVERYNQDRAKRSNELYLLARLDQVSILITSAEHDLSIAQAVDQARTGFHVALRQQGLTDLPAHMHKGELRVEERKRQHVHGRDGTRMIVAKTVYARIKGAEFLRGWGLSFEQRMLGVLDAFRVLNFGAEFQDRVLAMTETDKAAAANRLGAALHEWDVTRRELEACRAFLRPETGKTIQSWSMLPHSTYPMFFDYSEAAIRVGLAPLRSIEVIIPVAAHESLSTPPQFGFKKRE